MKTNKIILRDSTSTQFDDLITFKHDIDIKEVINKIQQLKKEIPEYTNEDVYEKLKEIDAFTLDYIGICPIIEY